MPWFVYILLCDHTSYYVGLTHSVEQRFKSHQERRSIATKEFNIVELIYVEHYVTRFEAEKRERQLKGWSVAKKKALITGNIDLLIQLSKTRSLVKENSK